MIHAGARAGTAWLRLSPPQQVEPPRAAMPSGARRPAEPGARRTPRAESFVTQVYFTLSRCSWRRTCCFALKRKQWGACSRRTLPGPRREDAEGRDPRSAKESVASQNANLAPCRAISRMTDKPKGNGSALPAGADPTHGPVADPVHGSSMRLPGRSGTRAPLDAAAARAEGDDQGPKQQRGFASITITARRVGGPVASETGPVPCRTPSQGANLIITSLKVSELRSGLRDEPQDRLLDPANEGTRMVLGGSGGRAAAPLSFTSCLHLRLSQQCPNTIYYLDRSLHVRIDQPRAKRQKVHRSELSFRINCSSSTLTADGVDGIANGEPLGETLESTLLGESKAPLGASWSADLMQNNVIKKPTTDEGCLGTNHPSKSACPPQRPAVVDIPKGPNNVIKKEDNKQSGSNRTTLSIRLPRPSYEAGKGIFCGSSRTQRAPGTTAPASHQEPAAATIGSSQRRDPSRSKEIQALCFPRPNIPLSESMCSIKTLSRIILEANIPGQTQFLQGDSRLCGSRGTGKEAALRPDVARGKNAALLRPGIRLEPEKIPGSPLTLREALEIHKPRFISRSRERLQRLEHKVQQRKAQQSAAPARARLLRSLSSASFVGTKRQYTVPHPLSDNLFKPKERFIPEKEMHMRSKRIYDNLPEVKKRQEEKQKRVIIQSNRLRVELFKKQLLDQLLQRNTE